MTTIIDLFNIDIIRDNITSHQLDLEKNILLEKIKNAKKN